MLLEFKKTQMLIFAFMIFVFSFAAVQYVLHLDNMRPKFKSYDVLPPCAYILQNKLLGLVHGDLTYSLSALTLCFEF